MISKNARGNSLLKTEAPNFPDQPNESSDFLGQMNLSQTNQKDSDNQSSASSQTTYNTQSVNNPNQQSSQNLSHKNNLSLTYTFDPWAECLSIFFSYDFIFTKCPQARVDAWQFIYSRLQQLLPFVDPNEPHDMPRTSILFGGGANSLEKIRKAANERDANLNLWKNYLIGACCLTSGTDRYIYYGDYEKALHKIDDSNIVKVSYIYIYYLCVYINC